MFTHSIEHAAFAADLLSIMRNRRISIDRIAVTFAAEEGQSVHRKEAVRHLATHIAEWLQEISPTTGTGSTQNTTPPSS